MKTINLPVHGIVVEYDEESPGKGSITCSPDIYETCPKCGQKDCVYQCDESHMAESEDEVSKRYQHNGAVDGITSMILAHACAGINIESPAYLEGIETALDAIINSS